MRPCSRCGTDERRTNPPHPLSTPEGTRSAPQRLALPPGRAALCARTRHERSPGPFVSGHTLDRAPSGAALWRGPLTRPVQARPAGASPRSFSRPSVVRTGQEAPDAAQIDLRRCSVGHSHARLAPAEPMRDFTTGNVRLEPTREHMIAIVRFGRPGAPMVGRRAQSSEVQAEAVVGFVQAAFVAPGPDAPAGQGRVLRRSWCGSCLGGCGGSGTPKPGVRRAAGLSPARRGCALAEHGVPVSSNVGISAPATTRRRRPASAPPCTPPAARPGTAPRPPCRPVCPADAAESRPARRPGARGARS